LRESVVLLVVALSGVLAWLLVRRFRGGPGDAEQVRASYPPSPQDGGGRPLTAGAPPMHEPVTGPLLMPEQLVAGPPSMAEQPVVGRPSMAEPLVLPVESVLPFAGSAPVEPQSPVRNSRDVTKRAGNNAGAGRFGGPGARRAQGAPVPMPGPSGARRC
jgi:hypothetical protein